MPVLSKPKYVEGLCSELAHPWQPSCILANKEFMTTCLVESFKLYAMFYTVSISSCAMQFHFIPPAPNHTLLTLLHLSHPIPLSSTSLSFFLRIHISPYNLLPLPSPSISISFLTIPSLPLPLHPIPHSLFPVFIQLTALTKRKGLKHFIVHSIPAVLRSTLFLSLNGGPLLFWICLLR